LTPQQIARLCRPLGSHTRTTLARPRSTCTDPFVTDPILVDEIGFVKKKNGEWYEVVQLRLERKEARERSERTGTTLECQCCYGDVAFEEMVACRDEGHLFCVTCVRRYAEERIFGLGSLPSAELTCPHGDGCTSAFSNHTLETALPPKVMAKYNEMQFRSSIEKAHIDEMWYVVTPSQPVFFYLHSKTTWRASIFVLNLTYIFFITCVCVVGFVQSMSQV
jgi:hypothetical protein